MHFVFVAIFAPSKAYLEEQQEKLEGMYDFVDEKGHILTLILAEERRKARRQSLTPVKPTVHEIREFVFCVMI